jgi:hypothetical protein
MWVALARDTWLMRPARQLKTGLKTTKSEVPMVRGPDKPGLDLYAQSSDIYEQTDRAGWVAADVPSGEELAVTVRKSRHTAQG